MNDSSRTAKAMNVDDARALFAQHQIKYVLAQFVDIHGAAKAKAVPVEHLEMVLTDGAGPSAASLSSIDRQAFSSRSSAFWAFSNRSREYSICERKWVESR